jgi:thioester reductase-like protein
MSRRHVFVTGGTGSLAREIVPRLLRRDPQAKVTLLVRARDGSHAEERLRIVRAYIASYWPGLDLSGLTATPGDVTLPRLGLLRTTQDRLCREITDIVHAAASIKLNIPLECAREIHVTGTAAVLDLARRCRSLRRMSHISTAYVAGRRSGRILERELDCRQEFVNAYERSKFEAELLVRRHAADLPITVFRPSIIVGSGRDGHIAALTTIYGPIHCIASKGLRTIPGDGDTPLDLIPVDLAAEAIAHLMDDPVSVGRTYHITSGPENAVTARWVLARAIDAARPAPPLRFVPRSESGVRSRVRFLEPFLAYLDAPKRFDDAGTRADLPAWAARRPHPSVYFDRLLAFCRATGWGTRFPWENGDDGATRRPNVGRQVDPATIGV